MEKLKILVIDDDVALCESLSDTLEVENYLVESAYTVKDGIKKVEQNFYNIVLLDMKLPDSDGIKALDKIKEISPDTEVILFTAYASTESVIDAIDKGAFSYLPKPFEMTDLRGILKKACERQTLFFENRKLFDQVLEGKRDWENTFDSIKDLVSIHDVDSNITRCNKALADKLNAKPEDIVGEKCFKIFHGRNEPLSGCAILRCIETLKKTEEETECMGGVFLMSCFPRFDKSGNFIGIVHIARDITDRKQMFEALKNKELFEESVIDGITDMIIVISPGDYKILSANKAYLEKEGFALKDIQGKTCYEVTHLRTEPCCPPNDTCPMLETIETNKVSMEEHLHYDKDGKAYYAEVTTSPVFDKTNKLLHIIHISRDITERKQAELQIEQGIEKLRTALNATIKALSFTVEQRDPYTAGHQRRVSQLACAIADEMGLPGDQIEGLKMAGIVHDIGKIHIPTEILSRPGKLTKDEFNIVRSHAQVGYEILEGIEVPWPVADIVHHHHEHMDGSGYPMGLSNGDILMEARILCVSDVVEAMASHRPYRPALGMDTALGEISRSKGVHYDSAVVDACLMVIREKGFEFE